VTSLSFSECLIFCYKLKDKARNQECLTMIQLEMSLSNMLLLHEQLNIKIYFYFDILLNEKSGLIMYW